MIVGPGEFDATSKKNCLIVNARIFIDRQTVIDDGFLYVENGRVKESGAGLPDWYANKNSPARLAVLDASGYAVSPGFVNSHTHVVMNIFRDLCQGKLNVLESYIFPNEAKLTENMIQDLSLGFLVAALKTGTTCINEHYYFSNAIASAVDELGMRCFIGETIGDIGGAFPFDSSNDDQKNIDGKNPWKKWRQSLESWRFSDRIRPVVCPHATDTLSPALFAEMCEFARKESLPLHMHLAQTKLERERVLKLHGMSPVAWAAKNGALGEHTLAVHLIEVDDEDLKILQDSGATVVACPASQIVYERLAPINQFVKYKLPLVLATDCVATGDQCDMLAEARLFGLLLQNQKVGMEQWNSQDIFDSFTAAPGRVFGARELGHLRNGAFADLVFIKNSLLNHPVQDPHVNLVYSCSSKQVEHVMIDGSWRLFNGELVGLDESELSNRFLDQNANFLKIADA